MANDFGYKFGYSRQFGQITPNYGNFVDTEAPDTYLETFKVDSWAKHERQHERFTVADREIEN